MTNDDHAVERALRGVIRDHGWRLTGDAERLRATLLDVLGVDASEHRGSLDALVIAAEHGVPSALTESESSGPALVDALLSWGLSPERAAWSVDTWAAVAGGHTDPVAPTDPAPPTAPADGELRRPAVSATPTLDATAMPPASRRTALPPAPVPADPTPPLTAAQPAGPWWQSRVALAVLSVVVLAVASGGFVALQHHGSPDHPSAGPGAGSNAAPTTAHGTELVTDASSAPRSLGHPVAMAAKDVGVSLTALSDVPEVNVRGRTLAPPDGGRLIAFGLGRWSCENDKACGPGDRVHVEVDGQHRALKGGGPYVVAVPADAGSADLVMTANGITQRISLLTGKAAAGNIEVLARQHRDVTLDRRFDVATTTSLRIYYVDGHAGTYQHTLHVTVSNASLDYFIAGRTPRDSRHAFLFVNSWYTHAEDPKKERWAFDEPALTFVARDGTVYRAQDLTEHKTYATQAFEVPASIQGGRFVVGGPRPIPREASDGTPYTVHIGRHAERIAF